MKKENYKFLYPSFVNAESAISIANSNIGLKNSIYKEALKKNIYYGFIGFSKFKVSLVFYESTLCWLVKVCNGEWGLTKFKKVPLTNKTIDLLHCDGCFDEDCNIWCLVTVEEGDYMYCSEVNEEKIKYATKNDLDSFFKEKERINKLYKREKEIEKFEW